MVDRWETFEGGKPRAPRSWLQLALRYRAAGAQDWREGHLENISRSGLLFRAQQLEPLRENLEISFELPVAIPGEPGALVTCKGTVVRSVPASSAETLPALAITIDAYQLQRGKAPRKDN